MGDDPSTYMYAAAVIVLVPSGQRVYSYIILPKDSY